MNTLTNNELNEINGGAIKWGLALVAAGVFSFIAGLVDGLINPIKCRK